MTTCDVGIIGGGIHGVAAAAALLRRGAVLAGAQSANATLPWESFVVASSRTPVVTFVHSAVSSSPSLWSYDVDARVLAPITKPAVQVDGVVTRQVVATAS